MNSMAHGWLNSPMGERRRWDFKARENKVVALSLLECRQPDRTLGAGKLNPDRIYRLSPRSRLSKGALLAPSYGILVHRDVSGNIIGQLIGRGHNSGRGGLGLLASLLSTLRHPL